MKYQERNIKVTYFLVPSLLSFPNGTVVVVLMLIRVVSIQVLTSRYYCQWMFTLSPHLIPCPSSKVHLAPLCLLIGFLFGAVTIIKCLASDCEIPLHNESMEYKLSIITLQFATQADQVVTQNAKMCSNFFIHNHCISIIQQVSQRPQISPATAKLFTESTTRPFKAYMKIPWKYCTHVFKNTILTIDHMQIRPTKWKLIKTHSFGSWIYSACQWFYHIFMCIVPKSTCISLISSVHACMFSAGEHLRRQFVLFY